MSKYTNEIEKRRTFAIISHPDAGKTTLTEKFLLYGGAPPLLQPARLHIKPHSNLFRHIAQEKTWEAPYNSQFYIFRRKLFDKFADMVYN